MGSLPPELQFRPAEPPAPRKKNRVVDWLILAAAAAVASLMFERVVLKKDDGSYQIRPERDDEVQKRIERNEQYAEQYVLVARKNGLYPCSLCPEKHFYLYEGEIAKVGTTVNGERGRYSRQLLHDQQLVYIVEYTGHLQEALRREMLRLKAYPILPENLARPDKPSGTSPRYKLVYPPLNSKLQ